MAKKLQKMYLTFYSLLIAQGLWQAHYKILLIIYLNDFTELNINLNVAIKNVKYVELNISIAAAFLNTQVLKMI